MFVYLRNHSGRIISSFLLSTPSGQLRVAALFKFDPVEFVEPAHARIKTWCLTAWRRPNNLIFLHRPSLVAYRHSASRICSGDVLTPLATNPDHFAGTAINAFRAACSLLNAANTLLPVPLIPVTGESACATNQSCAA